MQRIVDRVEGMQAVRSKLKKQELDQQSNVALLRMIELLDARFKDLDSRREQDNKVGGGKCGDVSVGMGVRFKDLDSRRELDNKVVGEIRVRVEVDRTLGSWKIRFRGAGWSPKLW